MGAGVVGNHMMRTANATREDFNIEDLHGQVVYKMQRIKKLLKEIESLPGEREQDLIDEASEYGSGRLAHKFN